MGACKEQLSIENCDTNLKFYDQQKVMQEFIRVYSIALLGNHIANKEPIPEKDITDDDISQLTLEYERMIETAKSNKDLMKIHFKVLEDLDEKIRANHDKNASLRKELEDLEQQIKAHNEAKKIANSNSKIHKLLDAFV